MGRFHKEHQCSKKDTKCSEQSVFFRYLEITDKTPELMADVIARETDDFATRFWAGIFGFLHIPFAFVYVFILQCLR